jgi:hypothetical protein
VFSGRSEFQFETAGMDTDGMLTWDRDSEFILRINSTQTDGA